MIPIWSIVAPGMWWRFCHHMALRRTERVRLYKEYGEKTMDIVKNHPYQLCDMAGIVSRRQTISL